MGTVNVDGWKFEWETGPEAARLVLLLLRAAQEVANTEALSLTNVAEGLDRGVIPDAEEQFREAGLLPPEEEDAP